MSQATINISEKLLTSKRKLYIRLISSTCKKDYYKLYLYTNCKNIC